jgi:hypothetical protein
MCAQDPVRNALSYPRAAGIINGPNSLGYIAHGTIPQCPLPRAPAEQCAGERRGNAHHARRNIGLDVAYDGERSLRHPHRVHRYARTEVDDVEVRRGSGHDSKFQCSLQARALNRIARVTVCAFELGAPECRDRIRRSFDLSANVGQVVTILHEGAAHHFVREGGPLTSGRIA